jgi:hypothetical protein
MLQMLFYSLSKKLPLVSVLRQLKVSESTIWNISRYHFHFLNFFISETLTWIEAAGFTFFGRNTPIFWRSPFL